MFSSYSTSKHQSLWRLFAVAALCLMIGLASTHVHADGSHCESIAECVVCQTAPDDLYSVQLTSLQLSPRQVITITAPTENLKFSDFGCARARAPPTKA